MLVFLLACGDFGLTSGVDVVEADAGGAGGYAPYGEDDEQVDETPVSVDLAGRTWAVDLAEVKVTEPPGMGSMLALMDSTILLFHASNEKERSLDLVVSLAAADGTQNPCEKVQSLPSAEWLNPLFAIDEGTLNITISGNNVAFSEAILGATIDADGAGWHDGGLSARIDAREFEAALPQGTDMCELVDAMDGECEACDDGADKCFDLIIEDISAVKARGDFDLTPSGC